MPEKLKRHLHAMQTAGEGVFARLRAWFEVRKLQSSVTSDWQREQVVSLLKRTPAQSATVLPFPIRGEALLVQLADRLRTLIASRRWTSEPLLIVLSRDPRSRLIIDQDAYVEFDPAQGSYRVVLAAEQATRVTIETADFDTLVSFVAQYVAGRIEDAVTLEAAS